MSTYAQVNLKRFGGLTYSAKVELDNNLGNITRMENLLKNGISDLVHTYEKIIEGNYIDNLVAAERERRQREEKQEEKKQDRTPDKKQAI